MTDYTEDQKAKRRELQAYEQANREKADAERAAYLSKGNRHTRRKMKALSQIEGGK